MVNFLSSMVYGPCPPVHGLWCMVYGVWSKVNGIWSMVCDHGQWSMVYGLHYYTPEHIQNIKRGTNCESYRKSRSAEHNSLRPHSSYVDNCAVLFAILCHSIIQLPKK